MIGNEQLLLQADTGLADSLALQARLQETFPRRCAENSARCVLNSAASMLILRCMDGSVPTDRAVEIMQEKSDDRRGCRGTDC